MRIILSRKGFDSAAGGCPSPIIDGKLTPLPIPLGQPTAIRFGHLGDDYAAIVADLTKGQWTAASPCHLDPDIDVSRLPRAPGWRGALGQVNAALSHLDNQGVTVGDLFIFWGCYREAKRRAGRWTFSGPTIHAIFGWLQVGERHQLGTDGSYLLATHPWLASHPHVRPGWGKANAIFIAADELALPGLTGELPGYGILERGHRLSRLGGKPSIWDAPDWLHPVSNGSGMTYHMDNSRWFEDGTVQCVAQGQEFVADVGGDARVGQWLNRIIAA